MKKGFIFLAIVLWTIVAAAIVSAAVFIANGGINRMGKKDTLIKNEDIVLGNSQNIIMEGTKHNLEIRKTSGDSIIVNQYGNPNSKSEDLFLVSTFEDSIHIYIKERIHIGTFNFNNYNERLVVEIPEGFNGNLEAKALSGSIEIEDEFTLKNIKLNNSSGGIYVNKNITADMLNAKTLSGRIQFNGDITAKDLDGKTSSGGIRMSTVNVENYILQSSSGSIKIDNISGGGIAKTASGSIKLSLNNPKGDINLNSLSGSINVELEPSLQFTLAAQTNSGGIHTNFAVNKNKRGNNATANIGENPTVNIIAKTSSGGIKIEK